MLRGSERKEKNEREIEGERSYVQRFFIASFLCGPKIYDNLFGQEKVLLL
jgi:hypothetical protein